MRLKPYQVWLAALALLPALAMADNISVDVFAIPSQPIIDQVKTTSNLLKANGMTSFYAKGRPVHVTLYLTRYPAGSEAAIKAAVAKLVAKQHSFAVQISGFSVTKSRWAFLDVANSAPLQRLADETTMALSPMRSPKPPLPGWVKAYPEKLAAFERYGSPNVFQNFEPHLSLLAAEKSPALATVAQALAAKPPTAQGKIIGIGIGLTDQYGQQKKVLGEYFFAR
ncbi:2'-5' RNA ligase family protein [Gallaecimonas mangrovi]|uniref:2'-5' RNA ligase family protein n=1 Tax=Gallaecimonas mangrovi TaxID=2291597 RepID=UPI000E207778|nr:2'-5' RNA ligase family protein [Gallaecimonas mangrovi]